MFRPERSGTPVKQQKKKCLTLSPNLIRQALYLLNVNEYGLSWIIFLTSFRTSKIQVTYIRILVVLGNKAPDKFKGKVYKCKWLKKVPI